MFKLIESFSHNFIRFQPVGRQIKSGHIVQTVSISDDIFVELSNGDRPFGFCSEIDDNWVKIYTQKMVCQTSHFDKSLKYNSGDLLYVKDGILTTVLTHQHHISVGNVSKYIIGKNPIIELNWI
jgi:hypothetical protein